MSRLPGCIPISWKTTRVGYWLAYHHGWSDPRFYNIVRIAGPRRKRQIHDGDYIATVDDFGTLVPVADVSEWGFLLPRWPLWVERGAAEVH
jgi:hypothetical protein